MNTDNLLTRTRKFALDIINLIEALPRDNTSRVIARQLVRCGTSVGANYRAACRSNSRPDFVSKMGTVEEEADESVYWMQLLVDSEKIRPEKISILINETNELVAMTVASIQTARKAVRTSNSALRT